MVALIAVGYALVIGIRRRRRDLAILKTLGFAAGRCGPGRVAGHDAGGSGVVIGVPLGILVGRVAWRLVADGLGVTDHPTVPVFGLVAVAVAAIAARQRHRMAPGALAARTRPAVVLRSE